jgi:hypothetical protein
MQQIVVSAYSSDSEYPNVDVAVVYLNDDLKEFILKKQRKLNKHFPKDHVEIKIYNGSFNFYTIDENLHLFKNTNELIENQNSENPMSFKDVSIYQEIEERVDTQMIIIDKDSFYVKCYLKYNSEIFLQSDNISLLDKLVNL